MKLSYMNIISCENYTITEDINVFNYGVILFESLDHDFQFDFI